MYPEWFGGLAIGMAQTAKRKHRDRDGEARVINAFRSVFRRVRGAMSFLIRLLVNAAAQCRHAHRAGRDLFG
jgi:hypothetical protein